MRKWLAALLTLCLFIGTAVGAPAEKLGEYSAPLVSGITDFQTLVEDPEGRGLMAAALLMDYYLLGQEHPELSGDLSREGECRIGLYGSYHVEAYYPRTDGTWLNLFSDPEDGKLTVFVTSAGPSDSYHSIPTPEVLSALEDLLDYLIPEDGDDSAQPTAAPQSAAPAGDVPDVFGSLSGKVEAGQWAEQGEGDHNTHYVFYSYDNWSDPFVDATPYLRELESGKYPFTRVDEKVDDYSGTGGGVYTTYYYRYTGSKAVTPMRYSEKKAHTLYHLVVTCSKHAADDHFCISVKMSPELVYAGKDNRVEGNGPGTNHNADPNPNPSPRTTSKPLRTSCHKCHGDGKVDCSRCDGKGGKYIYDNSTRSTGRTWEYCSKCGGDGKVECTNCGGDGWVND